MQTNFHQTWKPGGEKFSKFHFLLFKQSEYICMSEKSYKNFVSVDEFLVIQSQTPHVPWHQVPWQVNYTRKY